MRLAGCMLIVAALVLTSCGIQKSTAGDKLPIYSIRVAAAVNTTQSPPETVHLSYCPMPSCSPVTDQVMSYSAASHSYSFLVGGLQGATLYKFQAQVFDSSSNVVYQSDWSQPMSPSDQALILILNPTQPITNYYAGAPQITAMTADSLCVPTGGTAHLTAYIYNLNYWENLGYATILTPIYYQWSALSGLIGPSTSAGSGTFTDPYLNAVSTDWTAPSTPGSYNVNLLLTQDVSQNGGQVANVSNGYGLTIQVGGCQEVLACINHQPLIQSMTVSDKSNPTSPGYLPGDIVEVDVSLPAQQGCTGSTGLVDQDCDPIQLVDWSTNCGTLSTAPSGSIAPGPSDTTVYLTIPSDVAAGWVCDVEVVAQNVYQDGDVCNPPPSIPGVTCDATHDNDGSSCTNGSQCCSNYCNAGVCAPKPKGTSIMGDIYFAVGPPTQVIAPVVLRTWTSPTPPAQAPGSATDFYVTAQDQNSPDGGIDFTWYYTFGAGSPVQIADQPLSNSPTAIYTGNATATIPDCGSLHGSQPFVVTVQMTTQLYGYPASSTYSFASVPVNCPP
ncbi:MAG TPA: hypothetical protein VMU39_07565 [Solirubrobacteraceae bacterium]|nr:hypothetical protein [Solirubrobacteraceae bacterium]